MFPAEQFKTLSESSCDGVCQITRLALAGQEKIVDSNIDAMQEFIKKSGEQLASTLTEMARQDPSSAWPVLLAGNLKSGMAVNLTLFSITSRLQRNLTAITQEQWHALADEILAEVDKCTSATKEIALTAIQADEQRGGKYRRLVA